MQITDDRYQDLPADILFYATLGRYSQAFAFLESNVGSLLRRFLQASNELEQIDRLLLSKKLDLLQARIKSTFSIERPILVADFDKWLAQATTTREARNRYVHGLWSLNIMDSEAPVEFRPISMRQSEFLPTEMQFRRMSFVDFFAIVIDVESTFSAFKQFRGKHQI